MITLCQANTSNTRKQNLDKYIAPSPWLIVINMRNCFVKTFIVRNTDELCRRYSGLDKFPHPQVSVHHMKYPYILVLFPLKRPIFLLWKSRDLDLNMEWSLGYIPEPKISYIIFWAEIIWFTMGIYEKSFKKKNCVFITTHDCQLWIMRLQKSS